MGFARVTPHRARRLTMVEAGPGSGMHRSDGARAAAHLRRGRRHGRVPPRAVRRLRDDRPALGTPRDRRGRAAAVHLHPPKAHLADLLTDEGQVPLRDPGHALDAATTERTEGGAAPARASSAPTARPGRDSLGCASPAPGAGAHAARRGGRIGDGALGHETDDRLVAQLRTAAVCASAGDAAASPWPCTNRSPGTSWCLTTSRSSTAPALDTHLTHRLRLAGCEPPARDPRSRALYPQCARSASARQPHGPPRLDRRRRRRRRPDHRRAAHREHAVAELRP